MFYWDPALSLRLSGEGRGQGAGESHETLRVTLGPGLRLESKSWTLLLPLKFNALWTRPGWTLPRAEPARGSSDLSL